MPVDVHVSRDAPLDHVDVVEPYTLLEQVVALFIDDQ